MAAKNEITVVRITDMSEDGNGIGRCAAGNQTVQSGGDNRSDMKDPDVSKAIFVKDTAPGDLAEVKIIKEKKTYAFGRLQRVLEPSAFRVNPVCPVARACGGCTLQHIDYAEQLRLKEKRVRDCLHRIGGIEEPESLMEPIIGMNDSREKAGTGASGFTPDGREKAAMDVSGVEPWHFRNKMQFPVGLAKDGSIRIGFYAGRTHSIIDLDDCATGHPVNRYILEEVRRWLTKEQKRTGRFIYDEERHSGLIRHIMTRVGFHTGELMVVPVVNGTWLAKEKKDHERLVDELIRGLQKAVEEYNGSVFDESGDPGEMNPVSGTSGELNPESGNTAATGKQPTRAEGKRISLTSVVLNVNTDKTNRILGNMCFTLYGRDHISDMIGENTFLISPLSFFQVNPVQTEKLYGKALEFAGLTGNEKVWDMYCGAGTISLSLAKKAEHVFGVEIVPEAVENANENARLNGIAHAEFFAGKAEEVVPRLYAENPEKYRADVVVVDPPRKGCEASLLDTILQMAPDKIVYVSCDPATLARDIRILTGGGYILQKAAPVDMFPQTMHVESIALLERVSNRKADAKVHIDVDLEDYYRIKDAQGKDGK